MKKLFITCFLVSTLPVFGSISSPVSSNLLQSSEPIQMYNGEYKVEFKEDAWNLWRSNIQNKIIDDVKIDYAPLGIIYRYTFNVDNIGNIWDIKISCSYPEYEKYAKKSLETAITNLQKTPILKFPDGSKRKYTTFNGLFLIGTQARYATPNNYSDYEIKDIQTTNSPKVAYEKWKVNLKRCIIDFANIDSKYNGLTIAYNFKVDNLNKISYINVNCINRSRYTKFSDKQINKLIENVEQAIKQLECTNDIKKLPKDINKDNIIVSDSFTVGYNPKDNDIEG